MPSRHRVGLTAPSIYASAGAPSQPLVETGVLNKHVSIVLPSVARRQTTSCRRLPQYSRRNSQRERKRNTIPCRRPDVSTCFEGLARCILKFEILISESTDRQQQQQLALVVHLIIVTCTRLSSLFAWTRTEEQPRVHAHCCMVIL